ncbi:MAG: response regulator transcription factor [Alphaproteobacteria bacterium]|nr:response regulator transcription factor [Alphaproteobacteria bacterium]
MTGKPNNLIKVLIVDDDATVLMKTAAVLEKANYGVTKASGGKEALKILNNNYMPNAIILDRQMPDMSGDHVLMQIRDNERTKSIPVIMLTGDKNVSDVSTCLELGANDYIVKPFEPENLLLRLGKIFRRGQKEK